MKKIRILLIIIIAINIIFSIILMIYNVNNRSENRGSGNNEYISSSIEINGKLLPENHKKFEEIYNKEENTTKLYKSLYVYVRNISKLYENTKNLSEKELDNFYEENKNSIENRFYTSNKEDFMQLIDTLDKAYKGETYNHKTVIIYPDTYKEYDDYITCNLDIILNNDSVLKYEVNIIEKEDSVNISIIPAKEV